MTDAPTRPIAPRMSPDRVPAALLNSQQWVLWKYMLRETKDGPKWTKVPLRRNGRGASSTDSSTWTSFAKASAAHQAGTGDGVGYVFSRDDGLIGIDLDNCLTQDVLTEEMTLSPMAEDLLASVPGYAEVSPSGRGLKLWVRVAEKPRAFAEKALGLELYPAGRYFTVTGDARWADHADLPPGDARLAVLSWLSRWLPDANSRMASTTNGDEADLDALRSPVDGWDLERAQAELLSKMDPDCGYKEWLEIGMALHHQFDGQAEALDLWEEWSASGSKFTEGLCAEKWDSFNEQHGGGVVTLRSVIKSSAVHSVATSVDRITDAINKINKIDVAAELEGPTAEKIRAAKLTELEREQLAVAIKARIFAIDGTKVPISTVRGWLKPRPVHHDFPDKNADGAALSTYRNVAEVLNRMGATVRYNVVTKEDEILIPSAEFTMDNVANASLAMVTSECARFEVPIGQVKAYITLLADQAQYSPVLSWITSRAWDGVDRLPEFYATVSVDPARETMRDLLMRRWLISAVAISYNTGDVQARGILVLQGAQNMGKTRWAKALVPQDHSLVRTGHTLDVRSADSKKQAISCWILELGELDATFKRSDLAGIKAFSSQQVDVFRKPYALAEGTYPRRTVMMASVNEDSFLHDPTGNSRFWSLAVTDINAEHTLDMQQVWAQVHTLYQAGERHYLDAKEAKLLDASNLDFTVPDRIDEMLGSRFAWEDDQPLRWLWRTTTEVLGLLGELKPGSSEIRACRRGVLRRNGGQKKGIKLLVPPLKNSADHEFDDSDEGVL